jgi:hypothetical protein
VIYYRYFRGGLPQERKSGGSNIRRNGIDMNRQKGKIMSSANEGGKWWTKFRTVKCYYLGVYNQKK